MAETKPQSFANHTRFDPAFHFFLAPVALANLIATIVHMVRFPNLLSAWLVVLAVTAVAGLLKMRIYALKVQDRVIRLEERLRLSSLLSDPAARSKILELREAQLVALRFAPDEELPALVDQTLSSGLQPKQIKQNIRSWRADHFRI